MIKHNANAVEDVAAKDDVEFAVVGSDDESGGYVGGSSRREFGEPKTVDFEGFRQRRAVV